jgi:hypothetical protein
LRLFVLGTFCFYYSLVFGKIVDLKVSDFSFSTFPTGKLAGRWKYELLGTNADKMRKLALGSRTSFKVDPLLYVIVEDPNDPVWSTYACLHRIVTQHLPPGYTGHLFCKRAPEKVLRDRCQKGDRTEAYWDPVDDKNAGVKAKGKLGKNKPTEMFRALAQRCGFTQAERFTSRSARRTGISMMAKSGVSQHILNQKARHSDTATNALYFDPHESALADASIALHYAPVGKYFLVRSILDTFAYSLY